MAIVFAPLGWSTWSRAQTPQTVFNQILDYRFFTVRRHNDVQGVESVFDDYRKNWLNRRSSGVLVGLDGRNAVADTPICSNRNSAGYTSMSARSGLCARGHVVRGQTNVLFAKDTGRGRDIREIGNLSYLGYENLVSEDMFLGIGLSGGGSRIRNAAGQGMTVDLLDLGVHLLGGYRIGENSMVAWNIALVHSEHDTQRTGGISGRYSTNSAFINGVWYTNVDLNGSAYVSLGLDYTLHFTQGGDLTESDGTQHNGIIIKQSWQGDFTGSALFVQPLDNAELFARVGASVEVLNTTRERIIDVPIDVGAAARISDNLALTGYVGATVAGPRFMELRGGLRLTGRL